MKTGDVEDGTAVFAEDVTSEKATEVKRGGAALAEGGYAVCMVHSQWPCTVDAWDEPLFESVWRKVCASNSGHYSILVKM